MGTVSYWYTNDAVADSIGNSGGLGSTDTSLWVGSNNPENYPGQFPFKLRLEPGTINEEVVKATSGAGTSATPWVIVRGWDGTLPAPHPQGVAGTVQHGMSQEDLALARQHEASDQSGTPAASGLAAQPLEYPHGLPASAWGNSSFSEIQDVTLAAASSSVLFSTIPGTFSHLLVLIMGKSSDTGARDVDVNFTINGDSSAKYSGTSVYATDASGGPGASAFHSSTSMNLIVVAGSASSAANIGGGLAFFPGYASTAFNCMGVGMSGMGQGTSAANSSLRIRNGFYNPSSQVAITSLTMTAASGNFKAGSIFSLYGFG